MFFECFCFCVLILQYFVITTLLTDCRGHWRVPFLLCAYELHGLLVLSGVLFLYVVGQASCSRPFLLVAATTLLLAALGFPSKWFIVLLDHSKRDVGR